MSYFETLAAIAPRLGKDAAQIEQTMTLDQIRLHAHWYYRDRERAFELQRNAVVHAITLKLG